MKTENKEYFNGVHCKDINDGWVTCTSNYQFTELQASASDWKLYLVSDDSSTDDMDVDNFSMTFQSGPIKGLVVPDPTGDLASCWGSGSELLVTSNNLDFDDVQTPTIASVTYNSDQTAPSLARLFQFFDTAMQRITVRGERSLKIWN